MKKLLLSLLILVSLPAIAQSPISIGDILCTDGSTVRPDDYASSGRTALGVVFYVDNSGQHGWAVALHNDANAICWSTSGTDHPNGLEPYSNIRDAIYDLNGYDNTILIRTDGNANRYPAAWAVDFNNGWYLPAIGQLNLLYSYIDTIDRSLQIANGNIMNCYRFYYWSSTELVIAHDYSCAFEIAFNGEVSAVNKSRTEITGDDILVRSVRNF